GRAGDAGMIGDSIDAQLLARFKPVCSTLRGQRWKTGLLALCACQPGVGERWPARDVDLLDRRCRASGTQALSAACIDAHMHEPSAPGARVAFGKGRRHHAIECPGRVFLLAIFGMLRVEGEAERPAD